MNTALLGNSVCLVVCEALLVEVFICFGPFAETLLCVINLNEEQIDTAFRWLLSLYILKQLNVARPDDSVLNGSILTKPFTPPPEARLNRTRASDFQFSFLRVVNA